jgi:hypothetical protein
VPARIEVRIHSLRRRRDKNGGVSDHRGVNAFSWSLFGLLATMVTALLALAGVGVTWIRDAFGDVRGEFRAEFTAVRGEMAQSRTELGRELRQGLAGVNARLDATNGRIDRIDGRIDGLTAEVHAGFTAVRADIAALDRRVATVERG